jgi:hypothetical protein
MDATQYTLRTLAPCNEPAVTINMHSDASLNFLVCGEYP